VTEMFRRINLQLFAEGDGSGSGENNEPGSDGDPGDQPEPGKTFDEAYVKKLRDEAANYRTKAKDLESKLKDTSNEAMTKVLKALGLEPDPDKNYEKQLNDAKTEAEKAKSEAQEWLLKAEVKANAVELGVIDPDAAYTLMDKSKVKVGDDGSIEGVKDVLEALIKDKPYLKGQARPGSSGADNMGGDGGTITLQQLKNMTADEIAALPWDKVMKAMEGKK